MVESTRSHFWSPLLTVAGYHTWRDLGRQVKAGENGITILAPILVEQKEIAPNIARQSDTIVKKDGVYRLVGFRTAPVFDIQQTHGKPLPQFAKTAGDPKDFADKLKGSGGNAKQTAGAEQTCSAGPQQRRGTCLTGPNWTMTQICRFPASA